MYDSLKCERYGMSRVWLVNHTIRCFLNVHILSTEVSLYKHIQHSVRSQSGILQRSICHWTCWASRCQPFIYGGTLVCVTILQDRKIELQNATNRLIDCLHWLADRLMGEQTDGQTDSLTWLRSTDPTDGLTDRPSDWLIDQVTDGRNQWLLMD